MMANRTGRARGVLTFFSLGAMLLLAACADGRYAAIGDDGGPVPPDYRDLKGWSRDNHAEAVPALLRTCQYLRGLGTDHAVGPNGKAGRVADWQPACTAARKLRPGDGLEARHYFEQWFQPVALRGGDGQEGPFYRLL